MQLFNCPSLPFQSWHRFTEARRLRSRLRIAKAFVYRWWNQWRAVRRWSPATYRQYAKLAAPQRYTVGHAIGGLSARRLLRSSKKRPEIREPGPAESPPA